MEKAFKIFMCVMVVVLIGWIILSFTDLKRKSEEGRKIADEAFRNAGMDGAVVVMATDAPSE